MGNFSEKYDLNKAKLLKQLIKKRVHSLRKKLVEIKEIKVELFSFNDK